MRQALLALASLLAIACASPAQAQTTNKNCVPIAGNANVGGAPSCQDVTGANPLPVADAPLPVGANGQGTGITASSGNVAAATATATMPGVGNRTNWVSGFEFTFSGATAASVITCTLTGVGTTQNYTVAVPAGVTAGGTPLIVEFVAPIPATGVNTAISASCPSAGAGNTNATMNIHGFLL